MTVSGIRSGKSEPPGDDRGKPQDHLEVQREEVVVGYEHEAVDT